MDVLCCVLGHEHAVILSHGFNGTFSLPPTDLLY